MKREKWQAQKYSAHDCKRRVEKQMPSQDEIARAPFPPPSLPLPSPFPHPSLTSLILLPFESSRIPAECAFFSSKFLQVHP